MSSSGGEALPEHAFYCFEAINAQLSHTEPTPPPFDGAEEFPLFVTWNLRSRSDGEYRLRGCIGNFGALPLGEGLREYACTSAFDDHRFDPIVAKEVPRLECGVSLLTDFEVCTDYLDWELGTHGIYVEFANPALNISPSLLPPPSTSSSASSSTSSSASSTPANRETYRSLSSLPKLKLSIPSSSNPRRLPTVLHATFLPEVAPAQGWSKVDAVDAAMRKAGFKGSVTDDMRRRARVSRYQSKKVKVSYEEWKEWRKGEGYE
ncbi:hypothetical protein JCM10207_009139 [Rhodosporidiobolus poonsookiae]